MLTDIRPIEHFNGLVTEVVQNQRIETDELTRFYLSSLLTEFMDPKKLTDAPLAITYLKAMESGRELSARLFKELGDISLFTSGFFSESVRGGAVDLDYYMAMGARSYNHLASIHSGHSGHSEQSGEIETNGSLGGLFNELSARFKLYVDVLTEVSERCRLTSAQDILKLYEKWLVTKSAHTEALLRAQGIEPQEAGAETKIIH
jgi:hypothetical protein